MDQRLENILKIAKAMDSKSKEKPNDVAANKRMSTKITLADLRDTLASSRLKITTRKPGTEKTSSWYKAAQFGLDKYAVDLKDIAVQGQDRLGEYWKSLSPETKAMLINTMIGSAVGGAGGAIAGASTAEEGQGLGQALRTGTTGALLGGAAAGAGTAGLQALTGGRRLPAETKGKDMSDRMSQAVIGSAIKNPALTAGTGVGGAITLHELGQLMVNKNNKGETISNLIHDIRNLRPGADAEELFSLAARSGKSGAKLLGLPIGMGLGYMTDKYIRGDYD